MGNDADRLQLVPQVEAAELVQWMYQNAPQIKVTGPAYQVVALPQPGLLDELLAAAEDKGCVWVLLDGPRQQRPTWMVDPWWSEQPEMHGRLVEMTQARCIRIDALRGAIRSINMG